MCKAEQSYLLMTPLTCFPEGHAFLRPGSETELSETSEPKSCGESKQGNHTGVVVGTPDRLVVLGHTTVGAWGVGTLLHFSEVRPGRGGSTALGTTEQRPPVLLEFHCPPAPHTHPLTLPPTFSMNQLPHPPPPHHYSLQPRGQWAAGGASVF